jgi:hypothetical protein
MKKAAFLLTVCGLLTMCGCMPLSLVPYYTEKDLVLEPALIGTWNPGDDDNEQVIFEQADSTGYTLIDRDSTGEIHFDVHLFKLGGKMFMDLFPQDVGGRMNPLLEEHLVPGHSLLRVDQIEPTLITASLNDTWMKERMKENPKALAHVLTDDRLVLTASTEEIQAFVKKHIADKGAFDEPSEMRRLDKR